MYVTRKLTFTDLTVDPKSPAHHGRFTANAQLKAYFGDNPTFNEKEVDGVVVREARHNRIDGTITDFMDGDTDLGFKVKLVGEVGNIITTGAITGTSASAEF